MESIFKIENVKDKNLWESFLLKCQEKSFLHSWNWGEFQESLSNKIWRLGIYASENLIGLAFLVKISAKRGIFLSCPHGPVICGDYLKSREKAFILKEFLLKAKEIARKERALFLRLSPIWEKNRENEKIFKEAGFRDSPIFLHPDLTWELNISPSEEELLSQMRKTTRYLIRQAQKNQDIEILFDNNLNGIEIFNQIYQSTTSRQHFIPYSLDYLKKEFLAFNEDNQIAVFLGKYEGEIISSAIIVYWQDMAFYHHGATSLKYPKIPVSYLLQWEAIKEAKRRGCRRYNFWGIAPEGKPNHPWQGFTLFKMGFGGKKKEFVTTKDFSFSQRYWFTYLFEKIRKAKRGL